MNNNNSLPKTPDSGIQIVVTDPSNPYVEQENHVKPEDKKTELENVELKLKGDGALTQNSVNDLTNGIVNEIDELYNIAGGKTPQVVDKNLLTSLFYIENSLKPEDSKDAYVGIGQMSKVAIKQAILKANKLYAKASTSGLLQNVDNYIIDNICSKGNEDIDEQTNRLWQESKTNAKTCGILTALYLSDLSDRYASSLNGNTVAIVMMYNAGEGNFQSYQKLGIVSLSTDKTGMTIDLDQVDKLDTPAKREKWNEAVNYINKAFAIKKEIEKNPSKDLHKLCDDTRKAVGPNDNYSTEPNMKQYLFAPDGVKFVIKDKELESQHYYQPGE